jgi:nicotinate-nucleotide pyrophosphorylase (carboxylating)
MLTPRTDHLIDLALEEDAGLGDVTSRAIFPARHSSRAVIDARSRISWSAALKSPRSVFARVDEPAPARPALARDGDRVKRGAVVMRRRGADRRPAHRRAHGPQFSPAPLRHRHPRAAATPRPWPAPACASSTPARPRPAGAPSKNTPCAAAAAATTARRWANMFLIKDNHIAAAGSLTRA